jgi:hypothetical protein
MLPVFPLLPVKKDKEKIKTGWLRLLSWLAGLKDKGVKRNASIYSDMP